MEQTNDYGDYLERYKKWKESKGKPLAELQQNEPAAKSTAKTLSAKKPIAKTVVRKPRPSLAPQKSHKEKTPHMLPIKDPLQKKRRVSMHVPSRLLQGTAAAKLADKPELRRKSAIFTAGGHGAKIAKPVKRLGNNNKSQPKPAKSLTHVKFSDQTDPHHEDNLVNGEDGIERGEDMESPKSVIKQVSARLKPVRSSPRLAKKVSAVLESQSQHTEASIGDQENAVTPHEEVPVLGKKVTLLSPVVEVSLNSTEGVEESSPGRGPTEGCTPPSTEGHLQEGTVQKDAHDGASFTESSEVEPENSDNKSKDSEGGVLNEKEGASTHNSKKTLISEPKSSVRKTVLTSKMKVSRLSPRLKKAPVSKSQRQPTVVSSKIRRQSTVGSAVNAHKPVQVVRPSLRPTATVGPIKPQPSKQVQPSGERNDHQSKTKRVLPPGGGTENQPTAKKAKSDTCPVPTETAKLSMRDRLELWRKQKAEAKHADTENENPCTEAEPTAAIPKSGQGHMISQRPIMQASDAKKLAVNLPAKSKPSFHPHPPRKSGDLPLGLRSLPVPKPSVQSTVRGIREGRKSLPASKAPTVQFKMTGVEELPAPKLMIGGRTRRPEDRKSLPAQNARSNVRPQATGNQGGRKSLPASKVIGGITKLPGGRKSLPAHSATSTTSVDPKPRIQGGRKSLPASKVIGGRSRLVDDRKSLPAQSATSIVQSKSPMVKGGRKSLPASQSVVSANKERKETVTASENTSSKMSSTPLLKGTRRSLSLSEKRKLASGRSTPQGRRSSVVARIGSKPRTILKRRSEVTLMQADGTVVTVTPKRVRSVTFTVPVGTPRTPSVNTGKTPTKTPPRQLSMQERLEAWMTSRGKTPSRFRHLGCFGCRMAAKRKQEQCEHKQTTPNKKSLSSSQPEVADEEDEVRVRDTTADEMEEIIDECLTLFQAGCPAENLLPWLDQIAENVESAKQSSKYWIARTQIVEELDDDEAVLNVFEEAVRAGAKPADEMAAALKEFVVRMQERQQAKLKASHTPHRLNVQPENIVDSSAIKYCLTKPTPYFNRLHAAARGDTPGSSVAVVTPVRRSTRRSCATLPSMLQDHDIILDSLEDLSKYTEETVILQPNANLDPKHSKMAVEAPINKNLTEEFLAVSD